ncbi:hypothetical protein V8C35DRAFT_290801 [Trichoderma chlorosporum]
MLTVYSTSSLSLSLSLFLSSDLVFVLILVLVVSVSRLSFCQLLFLLAFAVVETSDALLGEAHQIHPPRFVFRRLCSLTTRHNNIGGTKALDPGLHRVHSLAWPGPLLSMAHAAFCSPRPLWIHPDHPSRTGGPSAPFATVKLLVCMHAGGYSTSKFLLLVSSSFMVAASPLCSSRAETSQNAVGWLAFVSATQAVGSTARSSGSATLQPAPLPEKSKS